MTRTRGRGCGRGRGRGRTKKKPVTTDESSLGTRAQLGDTGDGESSKNQDPMEKGMHTPLALKRLSLNNTPETPTTPRSGVSANGTVEVTTVLTETIAPVDEINEVTEEISQNEVRADLWTNLFTNNRTVVSLDYIPPQMMDGKHVVQLDKDEVNLEIHKWNSALIAYFIGDVPGYNALTRYINQFWTIAVKPKVFYHEDGYYVIRFASIDDMNQILYSGPYTINNRPIILKPWTVNFDFNKEFPTKIPLWLKFPKLPMSCWGKGSLSRIASVIGVPIYADECTANQTKISYARMLIEVNVTQPLLEKIVVMDPTGNKFEQEGVYGWKPKFCPKCSMVGHTCPKQIPQPQAPQPRKRQDPSRGGKEWKPTGVIREPASDVPESFKQNHLRTTPTQSAMENVAQHEASPKGNMYTDINIRNKEATIDSPEFNLTNFPLLGSL
ncbi:hypothetical protein H5410_021233 [Solanum commersonii]|uniref:DUF4283 domain-containing protein n=1 Tax=Solanum commersonii TaxID=4109 RepID=A0A9J5ZDN3_SOLCO|nr:hypothetical protein H5410_021233 [Solanum commersonii]